MLRGRFDSEIREWNEGVAQGQRSWVFDDGAVQSQVIFEGSDVKLGRYNVLPGSSVWRTEDLIRSPSPIIAMTRTPVEIEQADREPVIADHTCAILHNPRSEYRRRQIDDRGERSLWLSLSPETVSDILGVSLDDPDRPFDRSGAPVSGESYLLYHAVARRLSSGDAIDDIEIEEMLLRVAEDVLTGVGSGRSDRACRESTRHAHREATIRMRRFLAQGFRQPLSLDDVARSAFLSPFHAARVFKRQTGMTIHENLRTLRIREALERMADGRERLAEVAQAVGFASHAHLTDAFGAHFGVAPSYVRRDPMGAARRLMAS